jgi:hypothetical protein
VTAPLDSTKKTENAYNAQPTVTLVHQNHVPDVTLPPILKKESVLMTVEKDTSFSTELNAENAELVVKSVTTNQFVKLANPDSYLNKESVSKLAVKDGFNQEISVKNAEMELLNVTPKIPITQLSATPPGTYTKRDVFKFALLELSLL